MLFRSALCTYFLVVAGAFSSTRMARKGGACVLGDWTFNVYAEIPALAITFSIADVFTRILVFVVTLCSSFLHGVRTKTCATDALSSHMTLILCNTFFSFGVFAQVATFAYAGTIAFIVACFVVLVVAF